MYTNKLKLLKKLKIYILIENTKYNIKINNILHIFLNRPA